MIKNIQNKTLLPGKRQLQEDPSVSKFMANTTPCMGDTSVVDNLHIAEATVQRDNLENCSINL